MLNRFWKTIFSIVICLSLHTTLLADHHEEPCTEAECPSKDACADECGSQSVASSLLDGALIDEIINGTTGQLKDMPVGSNGKLTYGGQFRHRYHEEENRIRPGGPARGTYNLYRWRNWLDYRVDDTFGLHIEMIDASIFDNELPDTGIDVNRWDILNAYIDLKILEVDQNPVVLRSGRQELQFGAQRLVSPLEFGNTRRNFEGFRLTTKTAEWDLDAFATRPVNTATGARSLALQDNAHDHADYSRTFSGVFSTYKGLETNKLDLYWFWLREQEPNPARADGSRHTIGSRLYGSKSVSDEFGQAVGLVSWDFEGAFQLGHDNGEDVGAGFFVTDVAYQWVQAPWKPKVKGVFYYTSGDDDPNDGDNNTFDDLFPLGHAYWGLLDNMSGQNLIDYSVQAQVFPTKKLNLLAAYHWFDRASQNDFIYNLPGVPFGTAPGTAGATNARDIGSELDLVANYAVSERVKVQILYAWFYYEAAVTEDPAISRQDATQFFVQTLINY
ncbi:MAG: hypothetical protein CMJ78_00085 [Planctomycetaceae bacterium]|nr:hypothetical protein [Planctomycetaceae bacterium]